MHSRVSYGILILCILAATIPVFAAAAPVVTGNARVALTLAPATTTPVPVTTVACVAPCQCLAYADAITLWGDGGFTQCAEHPCEVSRSVTGAPVEKYCYKQKPVTSATTPVAPVRVDRTLPATVPTTPAQLSVSRTLPTPTATLVPIADVPAPALTSFIWGTYRPLVISVGTKEKYPPLDTSSPYFAGQLASEKTPTIKTVITFSSLEVDEINDDLLGYFSGNTVHTNPQWGETDTSIISREAKEKNVNFRWTTAEKGVTGALYQISRYPFPADAGHWQNQYVPGLVGSGQVKEERVRYEDGSGAEYRYFRVNFARAANRNPGLPPYFDGTASLKQDDQGIGEVQQVTKIPLLNTGLVMMDYSVGSFHFGLPSGIVASGELTQNELGNPNANLLLSCTDCVDLRPSTPLETAVSGTEQTYYVRVVPIHADGNAGLPTLPVTVTIQRPKPCPTGVTNLQISPPSVKVLSFTPTLFTPHDRFPGGPQYFVAIKDPDNCTQHFLHKVLPRPIRSARPVLVS